MNEKTLKYGRERLTLSEANNPQNVWVDVENMGGGAASVFPLSWVRHLVNTFPPIKASRLETQLYDALEQLICELYADGSTTKGEARANRALGAYCRLYGDRHDGKPFQRGKESEGEESG